MGNDIMRSDWQKYYLLTKDRLPSTLLVKALSHVGKKEAVLDLGGGALKDSKFLIRKGFKEVIAVDKGNIPEELREGLPADVFSFVQHSFDEFQFPENKFDLVSAQFSLPFCPPEAFNAVWNRIKRTLKLGGIFTGQFFGIKDEWNKLESSMTFHTREKVQELLSEFEILEFQEEIKNRKLADGRQKRWHVFQIIARHRESL